MKRKQLNEIVKIQKQYRISFIGHEMLSNVIEEFPIKWFYFDSTLTVGSKQSNISIHKGKPSENINRNPETLKKVSCIRFPFSLSIPET